jgi:hypothetical protein
MPKALAINAMIKNAKAHRNMTMLLLVRAKR